MGFIDEVVNKVTEAGVAVGNKAGEISTKSEIHKHELQIDEAYKEIGKIVYSNTGASYQEQVDSINQHLEAIKELEKKLPKEETRTDEPKEAQ